MEQIYPKTTQESEKTLFAAVNSGKGFKSFYTEIFDREEIEHRYLIKGGPGTGKSTFMRRVGRRAEEAGLSSEYYLCSSDPTSIDAVVIDGRAAIIDATSPHSVECELAGARDKLINLGEFWNEDGLFEKKEEIKELSVRKRENYRAAYRFLSAAHEVEERSRELCAVFINKEKMQKAARRIAGRLPDGKGYSLKIGVLNSIGMKGRVRLRSYEIMAQEVYYVVDSYESGSLFLAMLLGEAQRKGNAVRVSYSPLGAAYPDAVFFEESRTAFILLKEKPQGEKYVNMRRFVQIDADRAKEVKREYRENGRMIEALVQSAADTLEAAGKEHFELERIYKENMDFEALGRYTEVFSDGLIKKLKGK